MPKAGYRIGSQATNSDGEGGYYWTSESPATIFDGYIYAYCLVNTYVGESYRRYYGLPVRPVSE